MNRASKESPEHIVFLQFWLFIAEQLGNSRLKIDAQAKTIQQLLSRTCDHSGLLYNVIHQSYKHNRCHHLKSPICCESVLDILGEAAYSLRNNKCDDLFDIELLEEIAWHISQRYGHCISTPKTKSGASFEPQDQGGIEHKHINQQAQNNHNGEKAPLISFLNYKIRLANTRA